MAMAICSGGVPAIKSFSSPIATDAPAPAVAGLIAHPALTPEVQIGILSVVDATGSATLGDIADSVEHSLSSTAALALVAAGVLEIEPVAVIDANTRVTRRVAGQAPTIEPLAPPAPDMPLPVSVTAVRGPTFDPEVFVIAADTLSHIRRVARLQRPGVYVGWSEIGKAYVGTSGDTANRVAVNANLSQARQVAVILDRNHALTPEDAQVAERILHQCLAFGKVFGSLNTLPLGTNVSPERYGDIRMFVTNAVMLLHRSGIITSPLATRRLMAGPRAMSDIEVTPVVDDGILHEMTGRGFSAHAVETGDGWVLLRGSVVRRAVMPSANSTASLRRAEWLHAGLLHDRGDAYEVLSNLRFDSASGAAQFVSGAKGRSWLPVGGTSSSDIMASR
jgi:hypothetical protein